LVSALSASGQASLVLARGHRVEEIPEVPLVISNESVETLAKTKDAVALLRGIGAYTDVQKVIDSKKMRRGVGKRRNRRYVKRRGPLVIYLRKGTLVQAFRNIPGVDCCSVERLNLLQLAPGGHLGRFVIWIKDAFEKLDSLYGTYDTPSKEKKDFSLPRAKMSNADLARIINSDEIQSQLKSRKHILAVPRQKKNPLRNRSAMLKLNPHDRSRIRRQILSEQRAKSVKPSAEATKKAKMEDRKRSKARTKRRAGYYKALLSNPCIHEQDKSHQKKS